MQDLNKIAETLLKDIRTQSNEMTHPASTVENQQAPGAGGMCNDAGIIDQSHTAIELSLDQEWERLEVEIGAVNELKLQAKVAEDKHDSLQAQVRQLQEEQRQIELQRERLVHLYEQQTLLGAKISKYEMVSHNLVLQAESLSQRMATTADPATVEAKLVQVLAEAEAAHNTVEQAKSEVSTYHR